MVGALSAGVAIAVEAEADSQLRLALRRLCTRATGDVVTAAERAHLALWQPDAVEPRAVGGGVSDVGVARWVPTDRHVLVRHPRQLLAQPEPASFSSANAHFRRADQRGLVGRQVEDWLQGAHVRVAHHLELTPRHRRAHPPGRPPKDKGGKTPLRLVGVTSFWRCIYMRGGLIPTCV